MKFTETREWFSEDNCYSIKPQGKHFSITYFDGQVGYGLGLKKTLSAAKRLCQVHDSNRLREAFEDE